jgi:hypothetical protein
MIADQGILKTGSAPCPLPAFWYCGEAAMAAPQSTIETRRAQMFPVLEHVELERVRRFGEVRAFAAGRSSH